MLAKLPNSSQIPAARERMRREIMRVDGISYAETTPKLLEINAVNSQGMFMHTLPYHITRTTCLIGGFGSLPLVFNLPLAKAFNTYFVTTDVPATGDLDTILEVGAWTWNWMEPPLGTISFFLLCMQFAREAANNLGQMTPTERHKSSMAAKLALAFPQYGKDVVSDYACATAFDDDDNEIKDDIADWKAAMAK